MIQSIQWVSSDLYIDLGIFIIFSDCLQQMRGYSDSSRKQIYSAVSVVLRNAVDWDGGRGERKKQSLELSSTECEEQFSVETPVTEAEPSYEVVESNGTIFLKL